MDYENKHREEIARATQLWECGDITRENLEYIFPDLKESEDEWVEKIRKELISYLNNRQIFSFAESSAAEKWITWLEKQSDQKFIDKIKPKFHEGDWITDGQLTCKVLGITGKSYVLHLYNDDYCHFETDIQSVDKYYHLWRQSADKCYHLWTIQDAEEGDILAWDDSKCIALFKNIYDEDSFNSYGFVGHCTGSFESRLSYHDIKGAHPATKEQRDILFQKMHEAGYEWDVENKKLIQFKKQGEQKPANKIEQKFHEGDWIIFNGWILHIDEVVDGYYRTTSIGGIHNSYDWNIDNAARLWTIQDAKDGDVLVASDGSLFIFAKVKDNSAYFHFSLCKDGSKEISNGNLVWETANNCHPAIKEQRDLLFEKMEEAGYEWDAEKKELKIIDWSKHIKYEPNSPSITEEKPVNWSEEDKIRLDRICKTLWKNRKGDTDEIYQQEQDINWLKSLRFGKQWKPSKEQIIALRWVLNNIPYNKYKEEISGLLDQINY